MKDYNKEHLKNLARYDKQIEEILDKLCQEAAKLGSATGWNDTNQTDFTFDNYPQAKKKFKQLIDSIRAELTQSIEKGMEQEWNLSQLKNQQLISSLIDSINATRKEKDKIDIADLADTTQRQAEALHAFQQRKTRGLNLSDRVWNTISLASGQIELAIEQNLSKGKPAQKLSQDIRSSLKEPDMMYRRYHKKMLMPDGTKKDVRTWYRKRVSPDGKVRFVEEPLESVGTGVYRSAYKNAMRLARTETNMAYHKADSNYYQRSPFVIGIRVILSNNHTTKIGEGNKTIPLVDICDELMGEYPAEFDFTGWHPQCRCVTVPIMAKREEVVDYLRRQAAGEDVSDYPFTGRITKLPKNFTTWLGNNKDRLVRMQTKGTLPYFVRENERIMEVKIGPAPTKQIISATQPTNNSNNVRKQEVQLIQQCIAKTPQEAIDYIKAHIADNITMQIKKSDLPLLNQYFTQIARRMQQFSIERFTTFGVPESRKAMASYSRQNNSYNINVSALRNVKKQWEGELKWRKKGIRYLAYESEDDVVRHALDHELGHKLLYQYNMKPDAEKLLTTAFREIDSIVGTYASTNADELFAECFAMYMGKGRERMDKTKLMIEKMIEQTNVKGGKKGYFNWTSRAAAKEGEKIYDSYDSTVNLNKDLSENAIAIKELLGDESKQIGGDFYFGDSGIPNQCGGTENCVNVCFANELRRRGINVTATKNYVDGISDDNYNKLFRTANGKIPEFKTISGKSEELVYREVNKLLNRGRRFIIGCNDPSHVALYRIGKMKKKNIIGHVIVIEVTPKGIVAYDHQAEGYVSIKYMINEIDIEDGIQVLRIDNMSIVEDKELISQLVQANY